jgi:ABC-type transport system involved in cytochrome c biogenesis permease component
LLKEIFERLMALVVLGAIAFVFITAAGFALLIASPWIGLMIGLIILGMVIEAWDALLTAVRKLFGE